MRHTAILFVAASAFAAFTALTLAPAAAASASSGLALRGSTIPGATKIQYATPSEWVDRDRGPLDVPGDVIAGTAGIVGDILGGPVYTGPYERDAVAACERRFRSFDPETGTYTTYSGEQVLCPYLGG